MSEDKHQDIKLELQQSDIEIIRLLEDLIEVLIMKGVIIYTDLPVAAMQKLLRRQKLRDILSRINPLEVSESEDSER